MQRQRIYARLKVLTLASTCGFTFVTLLHLGPWGPLLALRHIAAFPNCGAAETSDLAPSRAGEPGYWPQHDATTA